VLQVSTLTRQQIVLCCCSATSSMRQGSLQLINSRPSTYCVDPPGRPWFLVAVAHC
jgi:hypothetical protein